MAVGRQDTYRKAAAESLWGSWPWAWSLRIKAAGIWLTFSCRQVPPIPTAIPNPAPETDIKNHKLDLTPRDLRPR
ncbi:hypothetical protein ColTof4_08211 [Colletotrichum tofieldiae]|nr:hypothetical protein ColTof3_02268 [Colletotrichum tofieldiae]GKT75788.1 hypothetical protein ColTof4_08211 [Colletotrichum tofieldiae]GKT83487.1 hypothetical protein Ct61P_01337 [Colletotrichum tofieldiae]